MTINVDLRKRPNLAHSGRAWRDRPNYASEPFGCADCGQWFPSATGPLGLIAHICHERGLPNTWDGEPPPCVTF